MVQLLLSQQQNDLVTHPTPGTQLSVVQGLLSLQEIGVKTQPWVG
jgi:hypothetical protein